MRKFIRYAVTLVCGIGIGFAAGVWFGSLPPVDINKDTSTGVIVKASPDTAGEEDVTDEVAGLLTTMYARQESLRMQTNIDNITYPFTEVDAQQLDRLSGLFREYEWRANRTLSGFGANDITIMVELYTPDGTQMLTLYDGYDLLYYRDNSNDITAYYTYIPAQYTAAADLAARLAE